MPTSAPRLSPPAVAGGVAVLLASAILCSSPYAGPCSGGESREPGWVPTFGEGAIAGFVDEINVWGVFDEGDGPALFAGGAFDYVGGVASRGLARWDEAGSRWRSPGEVSGGEETVFAMTTFDDGNGPALYVGGSFTHVDGVPARHVGRWDGTSWSGLGLGLSGRVTALAVHDDGSGPALYAGGRFVLAGGGSALRVARWDGASWSAVGGGFDDQVRALAVHDDGTGPALYAGGAFTLAEGAPASHVARWDGAAWSPLGAGVDGLVRALESYDDGTGAQLYVGGPFESAGGAPIDYLARWSGTTWSDVGGGINGIVRTLATHDGEFVAAGRFGSAGGVPVAGIASWDGTSWSDVGGGVDTANHRVNAVASFEVGGEPELFAGGTFTIAGDVPARSAARWNGTRWSPLTRGLDNPVRALATFGDDLYAGGVFRSAGGGWARGIARWDGTGWSALGDGFMAPASVDALVAHDDGSGTALYVGGALQLVDDVAANHVARWDGTTWSALGAGVDSAVWALASYDDGGGAGLYAGSTEVARWNGETWSTLGGGMPVGSRVNAFAVADLGDGPSLYVGGEFTEAGGVPASHVVRWDGTAWSPLGGGVAGSSWNTRVEALAFADLGDGPALYVGGHFTEAGGVPASHVARWDGNAWSPLGAGTDLPVVALEAFDDGDGIALFVGGELATAGAAPAAFLARWDGALWSALGSGVEDGRVNALLGTYDGQGPALAVGGRFLRSPETHDTFVALWRGRPSFGSYCAGDGTGAACPCGNVGLNGRGCDLAQGTGGVELTVTGFAPDGSGGGTADFVATGYPPASAPGVTSIRGRSAQSPPTVFGDGLLCIGAGSVVRVNATLASGGTSLNPVMHGAGAGTFYYQVWLRNAPVVFCDPTAAFNLSNGVALTWP